MQKKTRFQFTLLFILIVLLCLTGCQKAQPTETPVTSFSLPVGFVPNVQFAPLYAAIENGYFTEENIELTLDHSMETDTVALVGAGKIPFGVCSGEQVLLGINQGLSLKYIAGWYQRYPVGIVALKESGIETMEDLKGKKVGIPVLSGASYIGLEALLQHYDMSDSDMQLESVGYTQVELLTTGKIDAAVIYSANEPEQLKALGYEINLIRVADNVPMVGNGLITNEKTIAEQPELVKRMVRAFLKGLKWTEENREQAYELSKKFVDNLADAENQELQKQVLFKTIELYRPEKELKFGATDPDSWKNMTEVMTKIGLIEAGIDPEKAYTNQFIGE